MSPRFNRRLVIAAGALALLVALGYFVGSERREAAHRARNLSDTRLAKIAADCIAIFHDRIPIPKPELRADRDWVAWTHATGLPKEFSDLRLTHVYKNDDKYTDTMELFFYKSFEDEIFLEVTGLRTAKPTISLIDGDYRDHTRTVVFKHLQE